MHEHAGRWIENGLAVLGGIIGAAYVVGVEILPHVGLGCAPAADHGVPWGLVIIVTAMVAPKTLGRMTAGRIYEVLLNRLPLRLSGKQEKPEGKP